VEEVLEVGLHDFIDDLQARLNQIGDSIFKTFVLNIDELPELEVSEAEGSAGLPLGAYHNEVNEEAQQQQQQ
jgi:hypothetical protein